MMFVCIVYHCDLIVSVLIGLTYYFFLFVYSLLLKVVFVYRYRVSSCDGGLPGTLCIAQVDLELLLFMLLPPPLSYWNYKYMLPCPIFGGVLKMKTRDL